MITHAVETRVQAKLHPGVLCPVHPNAPFDRSELAYRMPRDPFFAAYINQWLNQSISRASVRRSSSDECLEAVTKGPKRHDRSLLIQEPSTPTFGDPAGVASRLDCDNLDFVTIYLYGLTDQLSSEPRCKWGDIGDGPAAGDPLRPRQRSERLAAIIVAQDRDLEPNTTTAVSAGSGCGTALAARSAR
jgi:hypothetical protein